MTDSAEQTPEKFERNPLYPSIDDINEGFRAAEQLYPGTTGSVYHPDSKAFHKVRMQVQSYAMMTRFGLQDT